MTTLTCIVHLQFSSRLPRSSHPSLQHPNPLHLPPDDPSPLPPGDPASDASDDGPEAAAAAAVRARHWSHSPCSRRMRFPRCCSTRDMDRPEPHAGRATGGKHEGAGLISTSPIWAWHLVQRVRVMVWHILVVGGLGGGGFGGWMVGWLEIGWRMVFDLFFVWMSLGCIYSCHDDEEVMG